MKNRFRFALLGMILLTAGLTFSSCGSSGNVVLTVTPSGPVIVLLDDSLQLSANRGDVAWSVEGGDANGTVSASGLYTPPESIPVENPQATVQVESSDGQIAMALINLRAADSLSFGPPQPINDTAVDFTFIGTSIFNSGVSDRVSARLGSVQVDATWAGANETVPGVANIFYSQSLDLMGFSPPENLLPDAVTTYIPTGIETDSQLNPGIVLTGVFGGGDRVFFLGSEDQGQSFGSPVPIAPGSPAGNDQKNAYLRVDSQDVLHVVFSELDNTVLDGPTNIFYSRSTDSGNTWSLPQMVSNAVDDSLPFLFPSLAVDPNGANLFVCWENNNPNSDIYFSASSDGGMSFSTPKTVTSSGHAHFCRVARGPSGKVYLNYGEDDGSGDNADVFLISSGDGGANFSSPVQVNSSDTHVSANFAMMAVDSLERIDVVWTADPDDSGDGENLMHARSRNQGGAFVDEMPVATGGSGDGTTAGTLFLATGLRHDEAGRLYLQYYQADAAMMEFNIFLRVGQ